MLIKHCNMNADEFVDFEILRSPGFKQMHPSPQTVCFLAVVSKFFLHLLFTFCRYAKFVFHIFLHQILFTNIYVVGKRLKFVLRHELSLFH